LHIGRQIQNIEKAFNTIHAGFDRENDYPPKRFWEEPVKSGPYAGQYIDHKQWNQMLDEYYKLQEWDALTGLQTREGLLKIGLETVARKLDSTF
jgi:aldehyde:ferredoxin oxidoreductase